MACFIAIFAFLRWSGIELAKSLRHPVMGRMLIRKAWVNHQGSMPG
jgi:hypothetical protein